MEKTPFDEKIETERLILKPIEPTFANATMMYDIFQKNGNHLKFLIGVSRVKRPEDEFNYLKKNEQLWKEQKRCSYGIYTKENLLVGMCEVLGIDYERESAELGYMLFKDYTGKGYMTETLRAVTDNLFKRGFNRIEIAMDPENTASEKVAIRLGFTKEGVMREWYFNPSFNAYRDMILYSKLKKEWECGR